MDYPQLGNTHRSGNRFVGVFLGPVGRYGDAGTPVVNQMVQATVDESLAARASVGARYTVSFDGKHWWVLDGVRSVGRLSWSDGDDAVPHIEGELEVTRLLLDPDDRVINFGGIVRPA